MKVALAMSGGVDSSVAAYLLNKEHDCIGCTMKLYEGADPDSTAQKKEKPAVRFPMLRMQGALPAVSAFPTMFSTIRTASRRMLSTVS